MRGLLVLGLLLLLGAAPYAQDRQPPGGSNQVTGRTGVRTEISVRVPIRGVSATKAAKVLNAVLSLRQPVFSCPSCNEQGRHAGACARCECEVEPAGHTAVVRRAALSPGRTVLNLTINPHHWGSLVDLEALLKATEIGIDRAEFTIPVRSRILVTGVEKAHAKRLRGAFVDLKVFERVTVVPHNAGPGLWILPRIDEPKVTIAMVEEVLAKLDAGYVLVDVQWADYCHECREVPRMRLGEPTCRKR